ncbi:MAG TPA: cell division ATP-binding protein FtsE [Acidiferrobacterales bacterium]|nr:cell division ATP-binding protein FtsE [Acidiferrobacterales bacterium]
MIQLNHVSKRYLSGPSDYIALRDVSFTVAKGEMVFVTGHSGAGKSTLLRLLTLIERPTRGQLLVQKKNLERLSRWRVPYYRRELGVVFQDNKLLTDRSVFDNVALPLVASGVSQRDIPKRVRAALDMVGLLGKEKLHPIVLSGGEQQRVGIARAVVNRPPLLLADEPTGNLDRQLSDSIFDLFHDFNQHGVTVLIATHDLRQVERLGKRVLTLKAGELVGDTGAVG